MVLVGARWSRHRVPVLVLIGVLAAMAFETGVHSAHHLNSLRAGGTCAVASAMGHLAGTPTNTPIVARVVFPSVQLASVDLLGDPAVDPRSAYLCRAPPLVASPER